MKDYRVVFAVWLVLSCAPAARADDALEIKKVVKAHYDAIVVADPKAYDDYWADDRVEVTGRSETPNQYDIETKGETLALYWELAAMKLEKPTFEDVSVKVAKQEAELRLAVTFPRTEENFESYGARYRLRKTPGGWKIYFGRTWPIDSRLKDVGPASGASARNSPSSSATPPTASSPTANTTSSTPTPTFPPG